jgi:hypothetical protein
MLEKGLLNAGYTGCELLNVQEKYKNAALN